MEELSNIHSQEIKMVESKWQTLLEKWKTEELINQEHLETRLRKEFEGQQHADSRKHAQAVRDLELDNDNLQREITKLQGKIAALQASAVR